MRLSRISRFVFRATVLCLFAAVGPAGDSAASGFNGPRTTLSQSGPTIADQTPSERAPLPPPTIEDPHDAMHFFYRRLRAAENGTAGTLARMVLYSDSINGWDGVSSALRHELQDRFGDGGKGWVHIAPGWNYQHHRDVNWRHSSDWRTHVLNRGHGPGNRYGLGGVMAADGSRRSQATYSTTENHPAGGSVSNFRLFYQAYPGAGSLEVSVDEGQPVVVQTASANVEDRVYEVDVPNGQHSFEVEVGQRNVRLYGVVMETDGPGVVVDAIALIGARVARLLRFDEAHWRRQIELRQPDLLVFWLGGNNATSRGWNRANFIRDYGQAIAIAKQGRPQASCLIASITDVGERGTGTTIDRVPSLVEAQREVANAQQCAFFNLFEAMGGSGTMNRWYRGRPRLATEDFRHLTPEGSLRVGSFFHQAFITDYEAFLSTNNGR